MKKLLTAAISGLLLSQAALAEAPAVYSGDRLSIRGGAVIDANGTAYYRNIELINTGGGNFRIAAAELADLATVEAVTVIVDAQQDVAEVVVEGTKPTPCVDVTEPATRRTGNTLIVVLPLSEEPDSEACIQVIDDFEYRFSLDVSELAPGTYTIVVNGVEDDFVIAA